MVWQYKLKLGFAATLASRMACIRYTSISLCPHLCQSVCLQCEWQRDLLAKTYKYYLGYVWKSVQLYRVYICTESQDIGWYFVIIVVVLGISKSECSRVVSSSLLRRSLHFHRPPSSFPFKSIHRVILWHHSLYTMCAVKSRCRDVCLVFCLCRGYNIKKLLVKLCSFALVHFATTVVWGLVCVFGSRRMSSSIGR